MAEQRLEARVSGWVQGVGFRAYARDVARSLGLAGGVRNGEDGAVYVVAEGPRERLDRLVSALRDGPGAVERVDLNWSETSAMGGPFEVWR